MKLIENATLYKVSQDLSIEANCHKVLAIVESFSCKMITNEKKMYKHSLEIWGPNAHHPLSMPEYGNLPADEESYKTVDGKTFFNLIQALNSVYDTSFDFTDADSRYFSREFNMWRMQNALVELIPWAQNDYDTVKYMAWKEIDQEIKLEECEMYIYDPEKYPKAITDCPSFLGVHQIYYNRKMKRMLVVALRVVSCFSCEYAEAIRARELIPDDYMEYMEAYD